MDDDDPDPELSHVLLKLKTSVDGQKDIEVFLGDVEERSIIERYPTLDRERSRLG